MNVIGLIRRRASAIYRSVANRNVKRDFLNALPFWVGAFITGLVAVLYAKLFALAESGTRYIISHGSWLLFIVTPVAFLLAWWLVLKFAPFARGSGIPQVSAAIELANPKDRYKIDSLLGLRVIVVKVISSMIMILGGGVIGREGPTIQIAASVFKKIKALLPRWYPKISGRIMIVTGAAAGLASAFNTPLGGIVFAIEELTKTHFNFFKTAVLTGVIIAGLTALNFLGPYLYLGYPKLDDVSIWVIPILISVALITGIAGSGMGRAILYLLRKKRTLKTTYTKAIYAVVAGLIIAALAVWVDLRVLGSGKEIMVTSLFTGDKHLEWYVPVLRIAGSIVSFSVGAAGGIFAPALSMGASIGAVISDWLHLSASETNLIILCAMAGALTGVTRSPFTSSILVIEMTNSHNIIFHVMLTALLANIVSSLISKHSFYEHLSTQYIHDIHRSEVQVKTAET